ncbi:MAG: FKBP-type peptidyl-prolyl cis-trans isomerase [Candidatus Melainabacteria bacterium]|nr:FKBP-type peptidyl-prolyl cis-trans isomerase [Candidatus Melainabacteria bacterium]
MKIVSLNSNLGLLIAAVSLSLFTAGCSSTSAPDGKTTSSNNSDVIDDPLKNSDLFCSRVKESQAKGEEAKRATLPGGLICQDIEKGFGMSPSVARQVYVHYTGYLADGTKFESSLDKGMPFIFTIGSGQVVAGFEQGLMDMKVGGKRKLTIPPDLAYGSKGRAGKVPPNETLTYEVQLLCSDR